MSITSDGWTDTRCVLQEAGLPAGHFLVRAEPLSTGGVMLSAHADVPDSHGLRAVLRHIELSADGWTRLVELFARHQPDAFAEIVFPWKKESL